MNTHAPIDPSSTALLVMDYQNGILGMVDNSDELLAIASNLTKLFRDHGGTVGYVRVAFADGDLDNITLTVPDLTPTPNPAAPY